MNQKYKLIAILALTVIGIVLINGCVQKNLIPKDGILTNEDIANEIEKNQGHSCYDNQDNYPKIIGKHSLNGLNLEEICFCSDYCPKEEWGVFIRYENVSSKEKCAEVGGRDVFDIAFGGYVGCAPNIKTKQPPVE